MSAVYLVVIPALVYVLGRLLQAKLRRNHRKWVEGFEGKISLEKIMTGSVEIEYLVEINRGFVREVWAGNRKGSAIKKSDVTHLVVPPPTQEQIEWLVCNKGLLINRYVSKEHFSFSSVLRLMRSGRAKVDVAGEPTQPVSTRENAERDEEKPQPPPPSK